MKAFFRRDVKLFLSFFKPPPLFWTQDLDLMYSMLGAKLMFLETCFSKWEPSETKWHTPVMSALGRRKLEDLWGRGRILGQFALHRESSVPAWAKLFLSLKQQQKPKWDGWSGLVVGAVFASPGCPSKVPKAGWLKTVESLTLWEVWSLKSRWCQGLTYRGIHPGCCFLASGSSSCPLACFCRSLDLLVHGRSLIKTPVVLR